MHTMFVRLVVSAVLLGCLTALSPGAQTTQPTGRPAASGQWKAGVARVTVTPREPIFMKGYGSRTRPSEGVRQDLFVKALALQDETGATSVLVTSDLHSYTRRMSDTIAEAVKTKYGLPRERLLLNASHTHGGPAITGEPWMRPSEDINAEQEAVIRRYMRHLPGPVDHDVPVLSVRAADGARRAIVFGYACHATSSPADYLITADWPGYAQAAMEAANPGAIAMFVNGAGADCDPIPRTTVELPKIYGDIMALAVGQVLNRQMRPVSGALTAAFGYADIPFQTPPTKEELQERLKTATGMRGRHARLLLGVLEREGRIYDHYPYPVQVWRFASGPTLIALGGETVVDYALRFKAEYGWEDTWVAGYSNDVMGYIPSLRVLKEGGYEGGGAMVNYGRPGPLGPAVEETIAGKVAELVARAGGKK
jgi:neutral ceramidase